VSAMQTTAASRHEGRTGLLLIALAAVLWGTVGVTTAALYRISATNALSIGFFRLGLAAPVLALACYWALGRRALRVAPRDLAAMTAIGAMLACYQVCFFAAIPRVGVAVTTLVTLCTAPVLVALLGTALGRERLTRPLVLALVCAILGTALMVDMGNGAANGFDPLGVVLALGSALGYAVMTLLGRGLAGRCHVLQTTTVGFASGAAMLLPLALLNGFAGSYPVEGWLLLLYLGLVPSALGYVVFLMGMRVTAATVASITTLLEPLVATLLAWLLFGERLGPLGALGAALLLGSMLLLYLRAQPAATR
jgi:drug/metabolite transporter, DME family